MTLLPLTLRGLRDWLPTGGTLSDDAWQQRHRVIVWLLWIHAVGLACFAMVLGYGLQHSLTEALLVAVFGIPAAASHLGRRLRTVTATMGLLTASAVLVHITNGLIEAHFHFFVILAVVALYQDWLPFLLGIGYVVTEHGTIGVLLPHEVYDHADAWQDPWKWALIHALFVAGLCVAMVAQWRFAELTQTERRRAAITQARLAAIVTSSDDAIMSSDSSGLVTSWNSGAERLLGYTQSEMLGQHMRILVPPQSAETAHEAGEELRRGESPRAKEIACRRKDGSLVDISASVSPIRDDGGVAIGYSYIIRDITERKRAERALEHQATHDQLTSLPNRLWLRDRLEQTILHDRAAGQCTALLVVDLDRFKEVNDTLGHNHGDLLLRELAGRMRDALPTTASIARLGGDEFAVLLPSADHDQASRVAEELIAAVRAPFVLEGYRVETGMSIGIALAPEHGASFESLFRRADIAMYVAKRENKGCAIYSADQDLHSPERLALVGELRTAIESDGLILHYQPKVRCQDGRLAGVEALVRWPHPERGLIPPDRFIPLAEQTGLIRPLTRWVIRAALRQCRTWRDAGQVLSVAVNLSMRNLHDPDLVQSIQEALVEFDLPATALELEITESTLMARPERALAVLTELHEMGIRIAVDDFGTGYSSLAYLKELPVYELKIDRCFVRDMLQQPRDQAIVRSTIDLAHHLGMRVVAEGVEDRETWELLIDIGCDVAQGYYMSRPLPATRVLQWSLNASPDSSTLGRAA